MGDVALARITSDPLVASDLPELVVDPTRGGLVVFEGIVRDHDGGRDVIALEYEAHPGAESVLAELADRVAESSSEVRIAVAHRIGALRVGDVALVCAVAAAHRGPAFEACARLVDLVKAEVPIWKRQRYDDGTSDWVGIAP